MTITRVGTNQQYADGWEKAFSGKRGSKSAQTKSAPSKSAPPKSTKAKKSAKKGRK